MHVDQDRQFFAAVDKARNDHGVTLTPAAQELVYAIVDAITRDPHPLWKNINNEKLLKEQIEMIDAIPAQLKAMAKDLGRSELSSFDVLHGVSEVVERLCRFDKP